ncbi:MAG: hypothetical protein QOE81_1491, partial [Verrucomicrobiota bacterium]
RGIQLLDAVEVTQDQVFAGQLTVPHRSLKLWDRRLNKWKTASAKRTIFEKRGEAAG